MEAPTGVVSRSSISSSWLGQGCFVGRVSRENRGRGTGRKELSLEALGEGGVCGVDGG